MQKQSLTQTCLCGQAITFPEGEIKFKCKCHAIWEIDSGGFWFTQTVFAPFVAKLNHYEKAMRRRKKEKRR